MPHTEAGRGRFNSMNYCLKSRREVRGEELGSYRQDLQPETGQPLSISWAFTRQGTCTIPSGPASSSLWPCDGINIRAFQEMRLVIRLLCHGWREVRRCIFLLVLSSFSQNRCWKGSFASYCTALSSICPAPPKRFTWGSLDSQQNPRPRLLSRLLCHLRGTCKQLPKEENQCD